MSVSNDYLLLLLLLLLSYNIIILFLFLDLYLASYVDYRGKQETR